MLLAAARLLGLLGFAVAIVTLPKSVHGVIALLLRMIVLRGQEDWADSMVVKLYFVIVMLIKIPFVRFSKTVLIGQKRLVLENVRLVKPHQPNSASPVPTVLVK